jgi:3',5'-cyclic AMP phosphodiesterase CpdA
MRVIVHISDLHFNRIDKASVKAMQKAIKATKPHLVIISGDLTQRARVKEYEASVAFLNKLQAPYYVIPGNHDIRPFYSPLRRFITPYDRYKEYISEDLTPTYQDDKIAVASVNTVRKEAIKDGRVTRRQINALTNWFKKIDEKKIKIVVTHHPFHLPPERSRLVIARRAKMAVHQLSESGIDIFLSGHLHQSSVSHTAERYKIENYSAVSIQAGTVSSRLRKEQQSFNLIFIDGPHVRIDTYLFNSKKRRFDLETSNEFAQKGKEWREIALTK